jgi:hypothetical protein
VDAILRRVVSIISRRQRVACLIHTLVLVVFNFVFIIFAVSRS